MEVVRRAKTCFSCRKGDTKESNTARMGQQLRINYPVWSYPILGRLNGRGKQGRKEHDDRDKRGVAPRPTTPRTYIPAAKKEYRKAAYFERGNTAATPHS
jgi:hypothetical protein